MSTPAILALADGTIFKGTSIGATGSTTGEVVFNTAMTGYQEILTDPSYAQQLVTLTYPHIGNTGCNDEDVESGRIHKVWANGLIIRDLPLLHSNFRSNQSLAEYLQAHNVVAIADIDTRKLTRILRAKGAQNGCILAGENITEEEAIAKARAFGGLNGLDLAKVCCDPEGFEWTEGSWELGKGFTQPELKYHVVAYDYGVKTNILRMLADRGCKLTVVPAQTPAEKVLALNPDGIFLSNGPGDPAACDYAIEAVKTIVETTNTPVFGICLGHQILALASGAKTMKMPHGHHGANHPVQNLETGTVMITSQNHGFAVDESTLPSNVRATHRSLFDGTNQGIHRTDKPAFSFQGHPEASSGPHDCALLFDHFIELIEAAKK
ncbi:MULTISPECIES: glutamine-hydrolyzing carbamoyl-phosphate synthase small subunit [Acinetobacter]|uniref:glutamine-hydrolyzing carbamoyl-phosphate synthase small subunit n=1 Tax=Acinetobacter TaxID=469 RepID=UPI001443FB65|nr:MULTISPECIES: glutamine-hydrolyzing carbamoyl-phosphate synthase small subunit [Acinetobacter]MBF4521403.1 glutamine-hydrolyzing carbamoyl-phosphate synthase small subunit [Acinetobacter towneri]MCA4797495.1 glutamine-hydrolyzing carbamoyl-phosphate synthase small subunit [Acinetobacter towneri]MDM1487127.1 glutamine-hydrolyzing carbamoyl-phosphate synthase small subunit [Acinetobacter towneri]MEB6563783.1 glutamine-hydrolyzing carbamoyl-phosphate synthase small subunit [Acinetobacter towner